MFFRFRRNSLLHFGVGAGFLVTKRSQVTLVDLVLG